MPKEPALEFEGTVVDILPGRFKVKLDNGHIVDGILSGKMRIRGLGKIILSLQLIQ